MGYDTGLIPIKRYAPSAPVVKTPRLFHFGWTPGCWTRNSRRGCPTRRRRALKTNRRDAVTLARLHRAGELTAVWAPDEAHEAVRDLVLAREAAGDTLRRKRQQLLSFLLRHGRIYRGGGHWTLAHRRWLAHQKFDHPAQQIVFQDGVDAIEEALDRLRRLEKQLALIVPDGRWPLSSKLTRRCAAPRFSSR